MLLLVAALAAVSPPAAVTLPSSVRDAVVRAVRARVGADAAVDVERVESLSPLRGEVTDAVILPGAVIGGPLGVMLRGMAHGDGASLVPVGRATVRVRVSLSHRHTTRALARGSHLADADLAVAHHVLPRGALRPWPDVAALTDARVLRDLPEDACLTWQVVAPSPAVVGGREVSALVRDGRIEVRATLVAVDSGTIGDVVRVTHSETRRVMRARVIGRAEVEIRHEP